MRKYDVKDIKEKLENKILNTKMNIYCYELIYTISIFRLFIRG